MVLKLDTFAHIDYDVAITAADQQMIFNDELVENSHEETTKKT